MTFELPELPERYFWRIGEIYLFSQPTVQIRRKVLFWSEEVMTRQVAEPQQGISWEANTIAAAHRLKRDFEETHRYRLFMNKVQGDYPPLSSKDW